MTAVADWRPARRILAVRLDNLGDVLMTTPAMAALMGDDVNRQLSLLTSPGGAALRAHLPWLHDVLVYDAPWSKGGGAARAIDADLRLIDALRARAFDAAVIFTVCTQSALPAALLCRLAGIPLRLAHCRENPYELLTHWVPDTDTCHDGMRHEVTRQLDLVRSVGFAAAGSGLHFAVSADDRARLHRRLERAGVDRSTPYVVLHPGASAASRRYPADRFGAAAAMVAAETACQVLVVGGPQESALVDVVMAAAKTARSSRPPIALPDDLSLGELAALIESAAALLCNNSGPAHIAAALGTPVVVLYALTNPQHTPWQVPSRVLSHDVPCRNCLKSVCPQAPPMQQACLLGVPATAVAQAVISLLAQGRAPA